MKKSFKNAMMLLVAMALPMGFASCSDDNNDNGGENAVITSAEMEAVANTYVNDVIYPTYKDLRDNCKALHEACAKLYTNRKAGTLTDADVEAACEAFKNARREWERSEAFLYGAATDHEIDPHIDSWPLDHDQLVSALTNAEVMNGIKTQGAEFVFENNGEFDSTLGFHGLEFVLFRNGAPRTAANFNGKETDEDMPNVEGIDELAFADAVSGDIYNMTTLLHYGWTKDNTDESWINTNCSWVFEVPSNNEEEETTTGGKNGLCVAGTGYGTYLLQATYQGNAKDGWFTTWQETMENALVAGCSNISQEVYTQKLGQAYRAMTQGEGEDASRDYIESPYSKRSFVDYQDNIYSIKNCLYGTRDINATAPVANSMMTLMKKYNYNRYDALNNALNAALKALGDAFASGKQFVDAPGDPQVKTCIDAVKDLDDELNLAGSWFRSQKVSK